MCLCCRRHTALLCPLWVSFSCIQGEESSAWDQRSSSTISVSENGVHEQTAEGWRCQGQLLWGQRLINPIPVGPTWVGALSPLHAREERICLHPRKFSHGRRRKGSSQLKKLNTGGSISREPLIQVTWDLGGGKKAREELEPTRVGFLSFFCQSSHWAWRQRKGEGLHDTKETAQSWCQVAALELASCRSRESWGLSPDPSRWVKVILSKPFAQWEQSMPLGIMPGVFCLFFCCLWEEGAKTNDRK